MRKFANQPLRQRIGSLDLAQAQERSCAENECSNKRDGELSLQRA